MRSDAITAEAPARPTDALPLAARCAATLSLAGALWRGARHAYPGVLPTAWARRLRFAWRAWRSRHEWRALRQPPPSPALACALHERKGLMNLVAWPYIHRGWPVGQRVETAVAHYQCIDLWHWLQVPLHARTVLAALGEPADGLSLQIDRPSWFAQEGELVVALFEGDLRLYSLAFSFGERNGQPVVYVGAIQGRSDPSINGRYVQVTRSLHGCRPRDLLVLALLFVAESIGIEQVYAVGDRHRRPHRQAWWQPGAAAPISRYDEIWAERGGEPTPDGFFVMDTHFIERPLADVAAKKRAMYRRRYQLLGGLRDGIHRLARENQRPDRVLRTPAR